MHSRFPFLLRQLSSRPDHFSRYPLNNESLVKRINWFKSASSSLPPPSIFPMLIDAINATRQIQLQNTPQVHQSDFLSISPSESNDDLENQLVQLLQHYKSHWNSTNHLIRHYLHEPPRPNSASVVDLVSSSFLSQLQYGRVDYGLVRSGIDNLLHTNDYASSFKLVDATLYAPQFTQHSSRVLRRTLSWVSAAFLAVNVLEIAILPLISPAFLVLANTALAVSLGYGFTNLKFPRHLGRVSWRMSKSPRQGVLHNEELFLVNRIITYFEENNEINLKNYHTSQVREFSNPNISRFNDYFVELPTSTAVTAVGQHGQYIDENIVALQQMFRRELIGRKIAINDLPEELHFVEFWMTQGENFEWVEPDQDPAEIVRFRKNS